MHDSTLVCGSLGGDAKLEGGCSWIDADGGTRYEVRYPQGWRVEFDPVRLLAPDGTVHASEGERVCVRGQEVGEPSICQVGPVLRADDVLPKDEP